MTELGFEAGFNTGERTPLQQLQEYLAGRGMSPVSEQEAIQPQAVKLDTVKQAAAQKRKDTYISMPYRGSDGEIHVTVHSTTGDRHSKDDFDKALTDWQSGKEPKGYTFLEPGVVNWLRDKFNIASRGAQSVTGSVGRVAAVPGNIAAKAGELTSILPSGSAEGISQTGENVGRFISKQMLGTPENALTTALSVGAGPWVNSVSGALSMLRQAAVTGGSQLVGKQLFGDNSGDFTKNLIESAMVGVVGAGTQGIVGALKGVFHLGVGEQAQREAAKQIVDKFKSANRGLTYDPTTLEAWASTPQGLRDITQVGVGALRGQLDEITGTVISQMNQRLPSRLSVGSQNTIRAQLRTLESAGRDFLHATSVADANVAQQAMDTARGNIYNAVSSQFTAPSAKVTTQSIMAGFNHRLDQFRVSAQMLNVLRESGADHGFNAAAFQQLIKNRFMSTGPGSFAADIGRAAFRGADPSQGTDVAVRGGVNIAKLLGLENVPALRHLNMSVPLGNKYVGSIPGTYPRTTGAVNAVSIPTIKEYLEREK